MKNNENQGDEATKLRRRAEKLLLEKGAEVHPPSAEADSKRLLHELEVHQVELELQNEELQLARDEAETALERYSDLYDFAPVGYFTLDCDGVVRAANLTGARMLGVERSRIIGRPFGQFIEHKDFPLFSESLRKVCASRGKESCEVALLKDDRQPLHTHIEAMGISCEECRVAVIDVTERNSAEKELQYQRRQLEELNMKLEQRVQEESAKNREMDIMLIQQNRQAAMGEIIEYIAHQWRQPLGSLSMVVGFLGTTYHGGECSSEFMDKTVSQILNLISHMSQTIDDFRSFSIPDRETKPFDLKETVNKILIMVSDNFKAHKITVDVEAEENLIVNGYPNEFSQVLLVILNNARDALMDRDVASPRVKNPRPQDAAFKFAPHRGAGPAPKGAGLGVVPQHGI